MENKLNYTRIILGGLAGGVIMLVIGMVIHGFILEKHYAFQMGKGCLLDEPRFGGVIHHIVVLLSGIVLAGLYAMSRKQCGAGPKTALCVGFLVGCMSLPGMAAMLSFYDQGFRIPIMTGVDSMLECMAGTLVAGWLYKE
ncbi:MAG: hypothetical protein HYY40_05595 [Bacteroidetes bacterium]|nr:hypothetical protein [Bacteroidota bacterium]